MNVADLFTSLALGELSNLSMAENGGGSLVANSRPKIILCANEGLLRLHSRFVLKEKELLLEMDEGITSYQLTPRYALSYIPTGSEDAVATRYIIDSPTSPFTGDLLKILGVYDANGGKLPLNDDVHCDSVFTPQANLLQVPSPAHEQRLSLLYQARHPVLTGNLQEEIELPVVLLSALTSYIAYKVFSQMNSADSTAKAKEYMMMYESLCADVLDKDLVNSSLSTTSGRFTRAGWI